MTRTRALAFAPASQCANALHALCPSLRRRASGDHNGRFDPLCAAEPALFLFVAGLALAVASRSGAPIADRLLAWILLLPIGVTGLWAAAFHLFFPEIAAADIGWDPSPFQFEVGMADLAIGATACVSFWRSLDFKAAVVIINAIFLLGDAIGHVGQMIAAGNFASGNAGVPFLGDLILPVLTLILLIIVQRSESAPRIS
jgi:hypothetical protein